MLILISLFMIKAAHAKCFGCLELLEEMGP